MTLNVTLTPRHRRLIAITALSLSVVLFGDVIYQCVMHIMWRSWIGRYAVAAQPTTQPASQPATAPAAKPPKPIEVSAAIRKRNLFAPPVAKGHHLTLTGVLGNLAFFKTQQGESVTIAEGASDRGVTVKSIRGYEVTIEHEGKPQIMKLFEGAAGGGGPGAAPAMPPEVSIRHRGAPPMPTAAPGAAPSPGRKMVIEGGRFPEGVVLPDNLPPEIREQLESRRANTGETVRESK